jgi:hypothetical protein
LSSSPSYPRPILVMLVAWLVLCAAVELFLILRYDLFTEIMLSLTVTRDAEMMARNRFSYLLGPWVLALIPTILVLLDRVTRRCGKQDLLNFSFLDGSGDRPDLQVIRQLAGSVTFVLLPALLIIHLGRHALGLKFLVEEDGPFELASAVLLVVSGLSLLFFAARLSRAGAPVIGSYLRFVPVLGLLLLLLGFEEVSWGQRLVGWGTGGLFEQNVQGETNLHNLVEKSPFFYVAGTLVLFGLLAASYLADLDGGWIRSVRLRLALPDRSLLLAWAVVSAVSFEPLLDELVEEIFAIGAFIYVIQLFLTRHQLAAAALRSHRRAAGCDPQRVAKLR